MTSTEYLEVVKRINDIHLELSSKFEDFKKFRQEQFALLNDLNVQVSTHLKVD